MNGKKRLRDSDIYWVNNIKCLGLYKFDENVLPSSVKGEKSFETMTQLSIFC